MIKSQLVDFARSMSEVDLRKGTRARSRPIRYHEIMPYRQVENSFKPEVADFDIAVRLYFYINFHSVFAIICRKGVEN